MALGEIQWLQFKGKKAREKDASDYKKWAFPYGQIQQDKITQLIRDLIPGEDIQIGTVCFLTAKEILEPVHQIMFLPEHKDYAYGNILSDLTRYKRMFKPSKKVFKNGNSENQILSTRSYYAALALADLEIDQDLNYPSVEDLKKTAADFEEQFLKIENK